MTNHKLIDPSFHPVSGKKHIAGRPYEINPGEVGIVLFEKTTGSLRGAAGILTYDIKGTHHTAQILYHVPLNRVIDGNSFHVDIVNNSAELIANKALYNAVKPRAVKASRYIRVCNTDGAKQFHIIGDMANEGKSEMVVEIWENGKCPAKTTNSAQGLSQKCTSFVIVAYCAFVLTQIFCI